MGSHIVGFHGFVERWKQPVVLANDFHVLRRAVQKERPAAHLAATLDPSGRWALLRHGGGEESQNQPRMVNKTPGVDYHPLGASPPAGSNWRVQRKGEELDGLPANSAILPVYPCLFCASLQTIGFSRAPSKHPGPPTTPSPR